MTTEEKIEEFRGWLYTELMWGPSPAAINEEFNRLFPPPKRGCWGFWIDAGYLPGGREFVSGFISEERANEIRDRSYLHLNPSPVFFLAEEGK